MTTGRVLVLCAGVPAVLSIIAAVAVHDVAYAGQGTFRVRLDLPARGRAVRISIDSGRLIVGAATGDRLRLAGTARFALVRSTVTHHVTPTLVSVTTSQCPFSVGPCWFRLRAALPAGAPAAFSNGSGIITATGLTSTRVTAVGNAGNITLTFAAVPDRVRVTDQFGDVVVVLPPGPTAYRVSAQAPLGTAAIRVPTSPSSAHVITVTDSSGDIVIRRSPG